MSTKDSKKEQPCTLHGVSGSISFYEHSFTKTIITAKTNINFFTSEVILEIGEDFISIKKPDIDYIGKTVKFSHVGSEWYITTVSKKLPKGKFIFDEESTEDELIAYYRK